MCYYHFYVLHDKIDCLVLYWVFVRVRVRACVRACARACVRACVRAYVCFMFYKLFNSCVFICLCLIKRVHV